MENQALDTSVAMDAHGEVSTLTELEGRILEFERQWWRYSGAKESAIKELFDLTPPSYYQLLNNLIDRDDALLASPMLVKRLRRLREARTTHRTAGFSL
jgi:Protein of unknown function (DUF3263)